MGELLSVMRIFKENSFKKIVLKGTVHQPRSNIYSLFDKLMILAQVKKIFSLKKK
jgi:hypothetical protein